MNRRHFLALSSIALAGLAQVARSEPAPQPQPFLKGFDVDGKPVSLDDYPGKVCLISFFTAGCNLCSRDLKLMREFVMDNRNKGFVLIAVNTDAKRNDYLDYAHLLALTIPESQRFPLLWRNAPGHGDSFGAITHQPTHFVLDKNHHMAFSREGEFIPDDWNTLWSMFN